MTPLPWWWSHLSCGLLLAAVAVTAGSKLGGSAALRNRTWIPLIALAIAMLLSVVPVGDVDVAGYLVAYSGELSFATLFYLSVYLFSRQTALGRGVEDRDWNGPRLVWAVAGFVLYVTALSGRGPDVYGFGFGPGLAWVALGISAALAISGRWLGAGLLLGTVWAWQLRLSGGANFWDYAIDPFIFVGSMTHVLFAIPAAVNTLSGMKR